MSLDVHLRGPAATTECQCSECDNVHQRPWRKQFFHRNITHNLVRMADVADIYRAIWRPEEVGITKARGLVEPLEAGLAALRADPDVFRVFNPANGWGTYENLVEFVREYLAACKAHPDATVEVSR